MRRAARVGDGWVSDLQTSEDILASIAKIQVYRREYGRDKLPFSVMATPSDAFTPDAYKRLEEGGVSHILTQPWHFYHGDTQDVAKKIDGVKRYADDYIAVLYR
jgi:alkanesulfonate monooxygenase SsuD/methylene tetrahydromethanopterin reductase-like flavin-dependent oxidoreductase (luciferase family)